MAIRTSLIAAAARLSRPAGALTATFASLALLSLALSSPALAQTDPGVRGGAINGQPAATATSPLPLASVTANTPTGIQDFFSDGLVRFQDQEAISGGANNGLGPRFNFNQCSGCHSQPTIGGTGSGTNPQFTAIANGIAGPGDSTPTFITQHGPTREARFPFFFNNDGSANTNAPNGGVETLFTVTGLPLANGCSLTQPSFAAAAAVGNLIFRIPTPLFGAGLIENIDDSTLISVQAAAAGNNLGISGTFNHNGNDGTIARFGWKAQNKSLLLFSGEAYNVEMGITNELFQTERDETPTCQFVAAPNTVTNTAGKTAVDGASPIEKFAFFMLFLAPPAPSRDAPGGAESIATGRKLFAAIGCALCHT